MNIHSLSNTLNPEQPHQLTAPEIWLLTDLTEDLTLVDGFLTMRARSVDFRETLNIKSEKSWHQTTVGEVVKEIAARHNLKLALGTDLTEKVLDHLAQINESDASFLMKLARQYGAIASVKDGNLLFIRQGQNGKRKAAAGYHHHLPGWVRSPV